MKGQTLHRQMRNMVDQQTILIVDDEWTVRDLLVNVIEQETAYRAVAVSDASQAFEVLDTITPGLFILDYGLPGVNGLELHDQLHAIEGLEAVPTIMLSAYAPSRRAMRDRNITYLTKPFDIEVLLSIVANLFARTQ
jgi:DNA-binding response OmpR family regulator